MRFARTVAAGLCTFAFAAPAFAGLIVDTGPSTETDWGWTLSSDQYVGVEVTLDKHYIVDAVNGWIGNATWQTTTFRIVVRDASDPDFGLLYSGEAAVTGFGQRWDGVSGLQWTLGPGTYLFGFEADGAQPNLYMPTAPVQPVGPGYMQHPGGNWQIRYDFTLPLQVFGVEQADPVDVPEPSSLALSLLALAAAGAARRRAR